MKKNILIFVFALISTNYTWSQEIKFGKIIPNEVS